MAVEKMTRVTLSGPRDMVDAALQRCVINREFHPENAVEAMQGVRRLYHFDVTNPYEEPLDIAYELIAGLEIAPDFRDFDEKGFAIEETWEYLKNMSERLGDIRSELDKNRDIVKDCNESLTQLSHLRGVDEELLALMRMKYIRFGYGRIPKSNFAERAKRFNALNNIIYMETSEDDDWVYGMYFFLPDAESKVDSVLATIGFKRIKLMEKMDVAGNSDEAERILTERLVEAEHNVELMEAAKKELRDAEGDTILARYSYLRFSSEAFSLRAYAGFRHGSFYIMGWIPSKEAESYAVQCESISGFSCVLAGAKEVSGSLPPVKMSRSFFSGIFAPFVEMFGLPKYNEIDPTPFLALTYTLIFGIMFGDVGQGAVLAIAGLLLWRLKQMWMGKILACVGISSIIFGFVYGSIFGYEHVLPGFKVLEGKNTMTMLIVAVMIGVVMLLVCISMNIINGIKQRDIKKIFFSPNGLAGFMMYIGVAAGVIENIYFSVDLFHGPYITVMIVIPLFLMLAAEPITKLVEGEPDWLPKSIAMFFVEGFFEIFETILSYVSNTISFLRIGAFAISHAGMMMVVFLLTETANGGNSIPGVIIGNLIVMGIEGVLVCIQVMRLEFYEMFGRFYSSGGNRFEPKIVDYKSIAINAN